MEILKRSPKERKRTGVLAEVKPKPMSVREAAVIMGMGCRQAKRVWQRCPEFGEAGVLHRARGKLGVGRREAAELAQLLARFGVRCVDFSPTVAADCLGKDGLRVNHETVRCWLLEGGAANGWAPWPAASPMARRKRVLRGVCAVGRVAPGLV